MNKLNPENPIELQQMLHAGMGRAILFLMNQDASNYRDVILDACLHNYAYDKQCEDERANYLYPLIMVSRDIEYYRDAILKAIPEETEYYDAEQLLDFAVLFAQDAHEPSRKAIYDKIWANNTDTVPRDIPGISQAIELDGIAGLIFCLEFIGSNPELLPAYDDDYHIRNTEEIAGVEEVRLALIETAAKNRAVATALANIKDYSTDWTPDERARVRENRFANLKRQNDIISTDTTWAQLKKRTNFQRLWRRWTEIASDAEFVKAALDLENISDPKQLASYLHLFRRRPFPLEPVKLIQLVDNPEEMTTRRALSALEIIHHPDVRALFNRLSKLPEFIYQAVGLLRRNYEAGDEKIIVNLLESVSDPYEIHGICMDIISVYEENSVPEGIEPLLMVYEKDPCSNCRCNCVEAIQAIGAAPDWMIEECRYDADSDTRELAESLSIV